MSRPRGSFPGAHRATGARPPGFFDDLDAARRSCRSTAPIPAEACAVRRFRSKSPWRSRRRTYYDRLEHPNEGDLMKRWILSACVALGTLTAQAAIQEKTIEYKAGD